MYSIFYKSSAHFSPPADEEKLIAYVGDLNTLLRAPFGARDG
ncbi:hypothetical protein EES40_21635 [Streptomyces sp. ADI93-02]|nr:hypothetical protein EES40_21635 [Streptomyces sp. ADI93-02]